MNELTTSELNVGGAAPAKRRAGALMARLGAVKARVGMLALSASFAASEAMAQVGGGTGTIDAVQARTMSVLTSAQGLLYATGALLVSGAAMYTGYSIMYGGKKWSDIANVAGGAAVAGMAVMISGWLFS